METSSIINTTYPLRVARMDKICKGGKLTRLHDLMCRYKLTSQELKDLKLAVMLYISRAFYLDFTSDEDLFLSKLDNAKHITDNITPNGSVVPKKEYQLELNMVLRAWTKIIRSVISEDVLKSYNVCPNIRIKFGEEVEENKNRASNTAWPHSDAWMAGRWGINCYTPIFGDIKNNNLKFWRPKERDIFSDEWIASADTYEEMQWVLDYYTSDEKLSPISGHVHLSDYALIHGTWRQPAAGTRISMDTTIFAGTDHVETHKERIEEYLKDIKTIGEDIFVCATRSIKEEVADKKSKKSHYTAGTLKVKSL